MNPSTGSQFNQGRPFPPGEITAKGPARMMITWPPQCINVPAPLTGTTKQWGSKQGWWWWGASRGRIAGGDDQRSTNTGQAQAGAHTCHTTAVVSCRSRKGWGSTAAKQVHKGKTTAAAPACTSRAGPRTEWSGVEWSEQESVREVGEGLQLRQGCYSSVRGQGSQAECQGRLVALNDVWYTRGT